MRSRTRFDDPKQAALFHDESVIRNDEDKHVRHSARETWVVTTHPRDDKRNRSFTARKESEAEARAYVEIVKRAVGGRDVTIVLQRDWRVGFEPDLVWCLWYRDGGGGWVVDEHH